MRLAFCRWSGGWAFLCTVLCSALLVAAEPAAADQAEVIFSTAEVAISDSSSPPLLGWSAIALPLKPLTFARDSKPPRTAWTRMTFDRSSLGPGPLAISIDSASERFEMFLNDQPLYRSFAGQTDRSIAVHLPYLIPVPDTSFTSGTNTLAFRLAADIAGNLSLDDVRIGPGADVKRHFDRQYLLAYLGPQLVSAVLLAAALFVFVIWLTRRRETSLIWLAAIGGLWIANNVLGSFGRTLAGPFLVDAIHAAVTFLLIFVIIGFGAVHHTAQSSTPVIRWAAVGLAGLLAVQLMLIFMLVAGPVGILPLLLAAGGAALFYARSAIKTPSAENLAMLGAVGIAFLALLHDLFLTKGFWPGLGFELTPYAGLVVFGTFAIALGRRFMTRLAQKESLSDFLGQRVETTKANLLASESARRSLEVSNAVTQERERMMREIHDGIGSSLVAALASAERQGRQSTTAVVALKNALTDLRIAVDSLEPVEGNVTTLLASLRYRLEPEMRKAGISFDWKVEDVPEFEWLDATNALHVLRIFQEAFSNILGHASASRIKVGCRMELLEGRPGVAIEVSDNGEGFDPQVLPQGRGRKNMLERTEALGGRLKIHSAPGAGSSTVLWLPLLRSKG